MKYGISEKDFKILENLVLQPLKSKGAKIFLFGSRAKGKHHPFSDVDLLIKNETEIPISSLFEIGENIKDSNFPYIVEIVTDSELAESYKSSVYNEMLEL